MPACSQLDVTDQASITAAAETIRKEFGRLDVLVNNAAISNTGRATGMTVEEYAKTSARATCSLDEVRAIWETNVYGPLAVYQAMLPSPARGTGGPHRQRVERRRLAGPDLGAGLPVPLRSSAPVTRRPRRPSTR